MKKIAILTCLCWLFVLFAGCVQEGSSSEPIATRDVVNNTLSVELRWSAQASLASSGTPMACYGQRGVIAGTTIQKEEELEGVILFDELGQVLWHQSGGGPYSIALDDKQVYAFKLFSPSPRIFAYDTDSGTQQWQTEEALDYRQGIPFLSLENDRVTYFTTDQINSYAISNGTLLSSESIPTENLYWRQAGIDIYDGNGYHLYATIASEPKTYLWATEYDIGLHPHVFEDALIVRMRQQVCSLKLDDGQINWCSDKQVNSNIAIHEDLGYVINSDGQLIAFRLDDGANVGALQFRPKSFAPGNFITTCDNHLLAYLRSPDQIFWFDFVTDR